jgi:hypothetical protein
MGQLYMYIEKEKKLGLSLLVNMNWSSHYTTYLKRLQLFTFTIYICNTLISLVFSSTKTIEQELESKIRQWEKSSQKKKKGKEENL